MRMRTTNDVAGSNMTRIRSGRRVRGIRYEMGVGTMSACGYSHFIVATTSGSGFPSTVDHVPGAIRGTPDTSSVIRFHKTRILRTVLYRRRCEPRCRRDDFIRHRVDRNHHRLIVGEVVIRRLSIDQIPVANDDVYAGKHGSNHGDSVVGVSTEQFFKFGPSVMIFVVASHSIKQIVTDQAEVFDIDACQISDKTNSFRCVYGVPRERRAIRTRCRVHDQFVHDPQCRAIESIDRTIRIQTDRRGSCRRVVFWDEMLVTEPDRPVPSFLNSQPRDNIGLIASKLG